MMNKILKTQYKNKKSVRSEGRGRGFEFLRVHHFRYRFSGTTVVAFLYHAEATGGWHGASNSIDAGKPSRVSKAAKLKLTPEGY
jgi:hypothetical protein